jgi:hypothetical protein
MNDATPIPTQSVSKGHYLATAEAFLHLLDPDAERFTFLLVNETGHPYRKPLEWHCTVAQIWPDIIRWNQLNDRCAAYVTINETDLRHRKAENIVRVRALFIDADTPESTAKIITVAKQTELRPSILVAAKPDRAHAYWLTNDTLLDQFRFVQSHGWLSIRRHGS